MSLAAFQRALCDLIASPELCVRLRTDPESVLTRYELSPREQRRLNTVVRQPGMATSCTLYRVNRITPLYTLLPMTSLLLGQQLMPLAEAYWEESPGSDLQFKYEVERFGSFLLTKLRAGELDDPYLEELVNFEAAAAALRYAPKRGGRDTLVRIVPFRHDPVALLGVLARGESPPEDLEEGNFTVTLDGRGETLQIQLDGN
jgi:hypothetical protein